MSEPKKPVTIQERIKVLDELVKYFEEANQEFDLETGLKKYETAMELVQGLKTELESYELKIRELEAKYAESETQEEEASGQAF